MVQKKQEYLAVGPLEEISKIALDFQGKTRAVVHLLWKLQTVIACYKRLLDQLCQKRYSYTEILTQALSSNFEKKKKNKNTTINTSTTVPLKKFQIKSLLLRILVVSKRAHAGFIQK